MWYIRQDAPELLEDIDVDQLRKVKEFKKGLGDLGALWRGYFGLDKFQEQVDDHLARLLQEYVKPISGATTVTPSPVSAAPMTAAAPSEYRDETPLTVTDGDGPISYIRLSNAGGEPSSAKLKVTSADGKELGEYESPKIRPQQTFQMSAKAVLEEMGVVGATGPLFLRIEPGFSGNTQHIQFNSFTGEVKFHPIKK